MAGFRRGRDRRTVARERADRANRLVQERMEQATRDAEREAALGHDGEWALARARLHAVWGFFAFAAKHGSRRKNSRSMTLATVNRVVGDLLAHGRRLLDEQVKTAGDREEQ